MHPLSGPIPSFHRRVSVAADPQPVAPAGEGVGSFPRRGRGEKASWARAEEETARFQGLHWNQLVTADRGHFGIHTRVALVSSRGFR